MKLLLEIERGDHEAFEVECDGYMFDVLELPLVAKCTNGQYQYPDGTGIFAVGHNTCVKCDGTGSRLVHLEGMVEVEDYGGSEFAYRGLYPPLGKHKLVLQIVQAHRDGTLPKSLYQSDTNPHGLREVSA